VRGQGGAGVAGAPRPTTTPVGREDGAQAVEFALVLPGVFLVLALLLNAGLLGADLLGAEVLAREGARAAAIHGPEAAPAAVAAAAGARQVDVAVGASGDLVTVRVRVRARGPAGAALWLPAEVTMRREGS
jgi:hypothetical protein